MRLFAPVAMALAVGMAGTAWSAGAAWPDRSVWRATSSAGTQQAMAPRFAIDGDPETKWGGAFSPGHWLQVDLGREASIGGAMIRWDSAFAAAYLIQASSDGETWRTVFETSDSLGGIEYAVFAPVTARYLRLASVPRTADWGVSVFEFEPLAADAAPRAAGDAALWSGQRPTAIREPLRILLPAAPTISGLEVFWAGPRGAARLEGRQRNGGWKLLAQDPGAEGPRSLLAARTAASFTALRLSVAPAGSAAPLIARLRLLGPTHVLTPMRRYQLAAERQHRDLFPQTLQAKQVYWTVVGVPAGHQKTVVDEWGSIEAYKGAPLIQPLWRDDAGAVAPYGKPVQHGLRDGWLPMPWLRWAPRSGVEILTEAFTASGPITWVRYRITNRGTTPAKGQFALLIRPIQVSPPWQNGGPAPIAKLAIERRATQTAVLLDQRQLLVSMTPVAASGAAPFGEFGETEITRFAAAGQTPAAASATDPDGLAAGLLQYVVDLAPGEQRDIVVALPLGNTSPALAAPEFDALAAGVATEWHARLGQIGIQLPDADLVNMLRAQAAYMLINQTGHALQPGPRNYDRSFIRDGSATAAILLRMGETRTARDYLRWYATHAVHDNGLVSPILNGDGSVNRGFGSDIEYDSQGQFIWLVAEVARLDGGPQSVREYAREVELALRFLQELRERTLVPNYLADLPAPERFRGILAPSISHEGYPTPTHSYWDNYWALKGWHDGAWLARAWGNDALAEWAERQYELLRESLQDSIRATMRWKGTDFVPSSADLGDGDPTGVSIGIDPTGQQSVMPQDALALTFDRYLEDVRRRAAPDALYAYTPYELRNMLTFVRLRRPAEAHELLRHFLAGRQPAEWQVLAEVVNSNVRRAIYLGDMPHTWIGSEYVRAIFGMLMHEGDAELELLPGTPPEWLRAEGLAVRDLPTARGRLSLAARMSNGVLQVTLQPTLHANTPIRVFWPQATKPRSVVVDGRPVTDYDASSVRLAAPFEKLEARW